MRLWHVVALVIVCLPSLAYGALTSGQQEDLHTVVRLNNVARAGYARSLVARSDLTLDESVAALSGAIAGSPFDERRMRFLQELVFGGASEPSRSLLAQVMVRASLARADAVYAKHGSSIETQLEGLAELFRIYATTTRLIANAGSPKQEKHDPAAKIGDSAYEACAKKIGDHLSAHANVLRFDVPVSTPMARVRAQAALALYEMVGDSPTRRIDAATLLGLSGARRAFLTEAGLLLLDSGRADAARVEAVRGVLDRLPAARIGVEAIYFGEERPELVMRGSLLAIKTPLEVTSASGVGIWGDEVTPGVVDAPLFELTRDLSLAAARRALDNRGELRFRAQQDVVSTDAAKHLGRPSDATVERVLASAMAMLLHDAPRTLDLAFARLLNGNRESVAVVSDALGLLAAYAPASAKSLTIALGSGNQAVMTNVKLAPDGSVTAFDFRNHHVVIARDEKATHVRYDGVPVTWERLPLARLPLNAGPNWTDGGLVFTRISGTPRAGLAPGLRVCLAASGESGFDAIATSSPSDNVTVEGEARVEGGAAGIGLRARADGKALRGVLIAIITGVPMRLRVVAVGGKEDVLADQPLPVSVSHHVRASLRGRDLDVNVSGTSTRVALPEGFEHGDVAFWASPGASIDASAVSIKR